MKYKFIILSCFILILIAGPLKTSAQKNFEFGIIAAMTQYNGDLRLSDGFHPSNYGAGLLYRYYFNPRINFKMNLFYGTISASDWEDQPHKPGHPYTRNLSFKSHIIDLSPQIEINILPFISGRKKRNWAPYIFGGVTLFHFNPKAELNGEWYELQPLGTEGQGTEFGGAKYKLTQFAIPYGIGFKYSFKKPYRYKYKRGRRQPTLEGWNIGLELTQRKTFTDHLDDVGGYYPSSLESTFGSKSATAALLCDRSGERNNGIYTRVVPNSKTQPRGTPAKDMYMWYGLNITKTFRTNGSMRFY